MGTQHQTPPEIKERCYNNGILLGGKHYEQDNLTVTTLLCFISVGYAQQTKSPGIQDSLIVGETYIDSGTTFAFVQIFAVTDDSVAYYNLPLGWTPPAAVYPEPGTLYFPH